MANIVRAYLDTVIVSALVKNDINPEDKRALVDLVSLHNQGDIGLVCSEVVKEEIDNIPAQRREPHSEQLSFFLSVPKVTVGGMTRAGPAGYGIANPRFMKFKRLEKILKDEKDRWHVFVASQNHLKYLVTVDGKTMLKKAVEVFEATGVHLVRPTELLTLIRAGNATVSSRA